MVANGLGIKARVEGLAKWDSPYFLAHEWNHIYGVMDRSPDEAKRLIRWWVNALSLEPSEAPQSEPHPDHLRAFVKEHSEFYKENLGVLANHIQAGDREQRSKWRWVARDYGYELRRLGDHGGQHALLDQLKEPPVDDPRLRYLSESIESAPAELQFEDIERDTKLEIARRALANKLLTAPKSDEKR